MILVLGKVLEKVVTCGRQKEKNSKEGYISSICMNKL